MDQSPTHDDPVNAVAQSITVMPAEISGLTRTLLDSLHEGVYFVDLDRRIQYWNKGAENISGFTSDEVVGHRCADNILMHIDKDGCSLCRGACPLLATIQDGEPRERDIFLHHKEGHRVPVRVSVAQLKDENGVVVGGLEAFEDITCQMAALEEAAASEPDALLCPLTGAGSETYSKTMLEQKLEEAEQHSRDLGVLYIVIDGLQALQSEHSQTVHDIIVKMVGQTLIKSMRTCDYLGRWEGDGFLALLPHMNSSDLGLAADQLRIRVQKSSRTMTKGKVGVTISVGMRLRHATDSVASLSFLFQNILGEAGQKYQNHIMSMAA